MGVSDREGGKSDVGEPAGKNTNGCVQDDWQEGGGSRPLSSDL